MNKEPVYPKPNPEYRERVMKRFYKLVKETNWDSNCGEYEGKPRGRKPKAFVRIEAKPRGKEKYNWFD
jgi:hypothetical protein